MPEAGRRRRRARSLGASLVAAGLVLAGCDTDGAAVPRPSASDSPRPESAWDIAPDSLAAVGDSITRGFDACAVLADCPEVSWATGSRPEVDSLAVRLLGPDATRHSWNHAVSGARMADLAGQMERAAAHRPALVTVLMGANDACRDTVAEMTSVADFRAGFERALGALRQASPGSRVFVAGIPDLMRLWEQGRTDPLAGRVWELGVCPTMLGDADATDPAATERRETVGRRVEDFNRVLEEVCAEDRLCRTDGGAVHDDAFGPESLSRWDRFHPSVTGQARLAEIAYRAVTAKDDRADGTASAP
ncbi:SGNH/GDSL hydrolase family protein [Streptomyces sp. ZYX-F-203]